MHIDPSATEPLDPPSTTVATTPAALPRRRKRSMGRWIGLGLLGAIIALVASTVRPGEGAFVYSKYVDEVLAEPQRFVGTELRVEGTVQAGTIENQPGSREYRFRVERNNQSLPVHYAGIIPDTFRDGIGVTVRGRLDAHGSFEAREVVAKCPSKYEMQAARDRGEVMPHGAMPSMPSTTAP
jgi:cytochrome c-type biogenesis protein CcmE